MISAVIFDFNGVLVDDESVHFDLFREVLEQEGVTLTDREYHERYLGYDDAGCFEHVLHDAGRTTDAGPDRRPDRSEGGAVRRGGRAGAAVLPARGRDAQSHGRRVSRGDLLGALRSEIVYVLNRLGLRDRVSAIIAAEDAHKCKPDPAGYLQSLDALRDHRPRAERRARSSKPATAWWSRTAWRGSSRPRGRGCGPSASPRRTRRTSFASRGPTPSSTAWRPSRPPGSTRRSPTTPRETHRRSRPHSMEPTPSTAQPRRRERRRARAVAGVLLSRDLMFTVKITGTARELGFRVVTAGDLERARR